MEIKKPNDLLVASFNNPEATTYDLMSLDITPQNTSLYKKEEYRDTKFVKDRFKNDKGEFDDVAFDSFYNKVANHYKEMTNDEFIKGLNTIEYSPFDITRPKGGSTYRVGVEFSKDINPYKQTYSRTGINSVDDSNFSLRELAQKSKVFDPETNTWSEEAANDIGLLNKFFGDTLVYAQWDEDGMHKDIETGRMVEHKKSDWKINDDGNLFLEKLGKREIYGKQVVNPTDMLTTDGSFLNNLDIWDSDSREKSALKTTAKVVFDIAPFLIPGVAGVYGGIKAAIGLSSVLPTFYKSLEGMLLGDAVTPSMGMATAAESYMAKFNQHSISDAGQGTFFNYEQMSDMVSSVFSQIYEQRAAASLSMLIKRSSVNKWEGKAKEIAQQLQEKLGEDLVKGRITMETFQDAFEVAKKKIPQLQSVLKEQSQLSKSLALGYMALTSTSDIYGQALEGGYDRRTAGFAALAAASGQYGIMMNNRMGDWFLDKGTGYNLETNKALIRKSVMPVMQEVQEATKEVAKDAVKGKIKLAGVFRKIKNNFNENFLTPSVVGEAMWKNAYVEGIEEVTEQMVLDATKGVIDTLSYLGFTKNKGSFGGTDVVFSREGWEGYLANLVGGVIGGGMFEFNRIKIEPFITGNKLMNQNTKNALYENIANGRKDELIEAIKSQKTKFGNNYISLLKEDGSFDTAEEAQLSQADIIVNKSIEIIEALDGLLNSQDLGHSDSDVVNKAIRDSIIIKTLSDKRGKDSSGNDNRVGIEGLVLTDYKNKREKILKLTEVIAGLSSDTDENKETISRLEAEKAVYVKEVNDILEGLSAEKYYNQIAFYLNKNISENWIVIDKDTFTKSKYGKPYKELPEKGLGITKETVDQQYDEYIQGKDVEKELEMATNAYLSFEATFNDAIASFVESGYSDEISKTFKNLFNNPLTRSLFYTEGEEGVQNITNYLEIGRAIEKQPGNTRVLPWEAIHSTMSEKIENSSGFSIVDGDRTIMLPTGQEIKVKDAAKNILHNSMNLLPNEQFDYNLLSDIFRTQVNTANSEIRESKKEIFEPLELALANSTDPEESERIKAEMTKHLITADLAKYENTPQFLEQFEIAKQAVQGKFAQEGLTPEIIERFIGLKNVVKLPELPEKIEFAEIFHLFQNYERILDLPSQISEYFKQFVENVQAITDITEQEKAILTEQGVYVGISKKAKEVKKAFTKAILQLKNEINASVAIYNEQGELYKKYDREVTESKKDLITNSPNIFKVSDVLLARLIEEIKNNKSLDGEVLRTAKEIIKKYILPITKLANEFPFTEEDIIMMGGVESTELGSLRVNLDQLISDIQVGISIGDSGVDQVSDKIYDFAELLEKSSTLPRRVKQIGESAKALLDGELDDEIKMSEVKNLIDDFSKTLDQVLRSKPTLEKVAELYGSISDSKKFISNPLYDLLRQINLSLDSGNKINETSIFDILEAEQAKLNTASDLSTYFSNGVNIRDLDQAINTVKLAQSVVLAMSTTELSFGDPYGFITSRLNFIKNNNLESDSSTLKTITSDMAQLMSEDLERISIKLQFLRDLAKYNSGLISREQKIIKSKTNGILLEKWTKLSSKDIIFKEKPLIPQLEEILSSEKSDEEKIFTIENAFYNNVKDYSKEDKIAIGKILAQHYSYVNTLETLYTKEGFDEITKDIKDFSNNDMLLYLLSNMIVSSKDFSIKLSDAFANGFDKAPFFTQELGVKIMYASLVEGEIFSEVLSSLSTTKENVSDKEKVETHDTSWITYVLGNAGTGKTTVMFKLLISMLLENNPSLDIWFSGPELEQAEKLYKDSTSGLDQTKIANRNLSKIQLFEALGIKEIVENIEKDKDTVRNKSGSTIRVNAESTVMFLEEPVIELKTDLPNIIFIDEVSHFKAFELELINKVVKLARENGKFIKVFAAGDSYQEGADFGGKDTAINYNLGRVSGVFIPQLFLTIRALNNQKRDNNEVLVNVVRKINKIWDSSSVSTATVFNTILQDGISLKYFKDNNKFNGDLLTNKVPDDILNTIAKNVTPESGKTLGILTDDGVIPADLITKLERAGMSPAVDGKGGYVAVPIKKVQGREFDYFIYNLSQTKRKSIFDTLKAIYTYSSRAKNGTIIVKDTDIKFDSGILELNQKQDGYTEELSPLNDEEILRLKEEKQGELKALIGANASLDANDFSFSNTTQEESTSEAILDRSIAKEGDMIDIIIHNSATEIQRIKFSISDVEKKNPGSVSSIIHTFYHDLGVKEEIMGDKVRLTRNPKAKYDYIMSNYLKDKFQDTMDLNKYLNIKNAIINEKFNVLKNKGVSSSFVKNIFGSSVVIGNIQQSFAIIADVYNDEYNDPKDLTYDTQDEHLKNGDKYLNLVLKLTYEGKDFVLHLGTFPKLSTIEKYYNANHSVFTSFKELLEKSVIGEYIVVEPNKFQIITSTRLYAGVAGGKNANNRRAVRGRLSLKELMNKPGIKFYDASLKPVSEPIIEFFPKNFEDYKKLFNDTTFGEKMTDQQLEESFKARRARPYIKVSFIDGKEHIQFITLHSEKRSWKEILHLIHGDTAKKTPSLREKILSVSSDVKAIKEEGLKNINAVSDSLFSADDLVDLWVTLAKTHPDLYKDLLENGKSWLDEIAKDSSKETREALDIMFGKLSKDLNKNVLDLITYSKSGSAIVYQKIMDLVKTNPSWTTAEIKAELLATVLRKPETKYWSAKFWNIFRFAEELRNREFSLSKSLDEKFATIIENIVEVWKKSKPEGLYYNVPIWSSKEINLVNMSDKETLLENLYTSLEPEGPHLLLDLHGIGDIRVDTTAIKEAFLNTIEDKKLLTATAKQLKISGITQNWTATRMRGVIASQPHLSLDELKNTVELILAAGDKEKEEKLLIKEKVKELNAIKANKIVILQAEDTDTLDIVIHKIAKATMIKDIHKEPKNAITLESLRELSIAQLTNILNDLTGNKGSIQIMMSYLADIKKGKEDQSVGEITTILETILNNNPSLAESIYEKSVQLYGEDTKAKLAELIENSDSFSDLISELASEEIINDTNEYDTLQKEGCK